MVQEVRRSVSGHQRHAVFGPGSCSLYTLTLSLVADASAYNGGASISQRYADGGERPIAYASQTPMPAEQKYAQVEKEVLVLVLG